MTSSITRLNLGGVIDHFGKTESTRQYYVIDSKNVELPEIFYGNYKAIKDVTPRIMRPIYIKDSYNKGKATTMRLSPYHTVSNLSTINAPESILTEIMIRVPALKTNRPNKIYGEIMIRGVRNQKYDKHGEL